MAAVFLTTAQVKRTLRIPAAVTMHDEFIADWLEPAEQVVADILGIAALTSTSYDETHDIGVGQNEVRLNNIPVITVAALTDAGALVASTDYYVAEDTGYIRLLGSGSFFSEGRQQVEVTYTAGSAPVKAKHVMAAAIIAADLFQRSAHAGFESERMNAYSYKLAAGRSVPELAWMLLRDDVRPMVV